MTHALTIHGFETSNNYKVRVGLGYKGIDYEFRTIDPAARDELVRLSGQYLTPVLVHGSTVLFDSAAILRYLDANFRDTPRLYGGSQTEQWAIEGWERFGRGELAAGMMKLVHHRVAGGADDPDLRAEANEVFAGAARRLEESLEGREWLVGETMTAADVTCAPVVHRVRVASLLAVPAGLPRVDAWVARVMAYDRR